MLVDTKLVEDTANAVLQPFGWNLTVKGVGAKLARATSDTDGIDILDKVYIGRTYGRELSYILWSRKVPYAFFRQQANLLADRLTEWGKRVNEVPDTKIVEDPERFDPGPAPSHEPVFADRPTNWKSQEALRGLGRVRFLDVTPNRLREEGACTTFDGKLYVRMDGRVRCFGLIRNGNGHFPYFGFAADNSGELGERDLIGTVLRYDGRPVVDIVTGRSLPYAERWEQARRLWRYMYEPGLETARTDRLYQLVVYAATAEVEKTFDDVVDEDRARLGDEEGARFTDRRVEAVYASTSEDPAELYRVFAEFTE